MQKIAKWHKPHSHMGLKYKVSIRAWIFLLSDFICITTIVLALCPTFLSTFAEARNSLVVAGAAQQQARMRIEHLTTAVATKRPMGKWRSDMGAC